MNTKIKMRYYVIFIKAQEFDTENIKCFTVYNTVFSCQD